MPNVLDRTKAIFIEPSRRLQRGAEATQAEIAQLRSVVGSLAWLGRVCRPDLSFSINQLQSVQGKARVQDLIQANKVLNHALKTRDKGIFYPAKPFLFEEAILISVTDASHAASFEQVHVGQVAGHRSQSGRLLLLAPANFETKGEGYVHLLSWSSNTIKRVCRSTLQAETLSLQLGSEECEHLRQCLYYMKNLSSGGIPSKNYVMALDHMICLWLTDCRSLSDHLMTAGMQEVSDKRPYIAEVGSLESSRRGRWKSHLHGLDPGEPHHLGEVD